MRRDLRKTNKPTLLIEMGISTDFSIKLQTSSPFHAVPADPLSPKTSIWGIILDYGGRKEGKEIPFHCLNSLLSVGVCCRIQAHILHLSCL